MNSTLGLKMMKIKDYDKTCWVSNFILTDETRLAECPGKTLDLCRECGFGMSGEMYSVIHLKPDANFVCIKTENIMRVFVLSSTGLFMGLCPVIQGTCHFFKIFHCL